MRSYTNVAFASFTGVVPFRSKRVDTEARRHFFNLTRCSLMAKRTSGAAERNKEPILNVLQRVLPHTGTLIEISSGTGQHVAHFAAAMPQWTFHPTEYDKEELESIDACSEGLSNVKPAITLDVTSASWNVPNEVDAVFNANMIHISPWNTTPGLMSGAVRHLKSDGILVTYGPYIVDGETAPTNIQFSQSLKSRDPTWGVRELRDVEKVANDSGMQLREIIEMPANNLSVIWVKKKVE